MAERMRRLIYGAAVLAALGLSGPAQGQDGTPTVLTLERGVELALENNETLRIAREDLYRAGQQVREARADALPQVNATGTYTRNWKLPTFIFGSPPDVQEVPIGTKNNFAGSLSLRQTLYSWGKVGAALKVAGLFREFSEEGLRLVRQQVQSDVELAYYDLLLAEDLVRVSNLALQRARENRRRVQRLREAGRVSGYELLRAEVQVSSRRPDSIRAGNGRILAELNLKNTVGLDPSSRIAVSGGFRTGTVLDAGVPVEELIRFGLERRPEMRQIRREVQMRKQAIRIEQAASRPSLDLTTSGNVQIQSNEFELKTDEAKKSWSSGLVLSFPLFDGMRTRSKVLQAKAEKRKADLQLKSAERSISLQIRQAWLELKVAEEQLAAQELALSQARRGLEIAQSRYTNGVGTQLELLDAELVLLGSDTEFAQQKRNRAVALVALEQASGVLGESLEPEPEAGN